MKRAKRRRTVEIKRLDSRPVYPTSSSSKSTSDPNRNVDPLILTVSLDPPTKTASRIRIHHHRPPRTASDEPAP